MKYKWHYFLGAVIFCSYLLISRGVPIVPVICGCVLAAMLTWRKIARQSSAGI